MKGTYSLEIFDFNIDYFDDSHSLITSPNDDDKDDDNDDNIFKDLETNSIFNQKIDLFNKIIKKLTKTTSKNHEAENLLKNLNQFEKVTASQGIIRKPSCYENSNTLSKFKQKSSFVVLVMSARNNFKRRNVIRETYGKGFDNVYFLVGDSYCPYAKNDIVVCGMYSASIFKPSIFTFALYRFKVVIC